MMLSFPHFCFVRRQAQPAPRSEDKHDSRAGAATMVMEGETVEQRVGTTSDKSSIVDMLEEPGTSKLLVSTQSKPTPDGWPAIMTQHEWGTGDLTINVLTRIGRMRARKP